MNTKENLIEHVEPEVEEKKPEIIRFEPGWYKDIPNEVYHKSAGVSSSELKKFLKKTPKHVQYEKAHPKEPTKNMQLGTAVHCLVLEPEKVNDEIAVMPELNLRTKDGRAKCDHFEAVNKGKVILTADQWTQAQDMAASLVRYIEDDEFLAEITKNCIHESSIYGWFKTRDEEDGTEYKTMVKARPDSLSTEYPIVFDVKTTDDATESAYQRTIERFDYHLSGAMYLDVINNCDQLLNELKLNTVGSYYYQYFVHLIVENEPPYLSNCFQLSEKHLSIGYALYQRAVRARRKAIDENWPAFSSAIKIIEPTPWAERLHMI